MGISCSTYYLWQKNYPEISEAIKKGKAPVDIQVENALLKRALGYSTTETIEEIYQTGEGSNKKVQSSHIRRITREIPPDVGAIVFWLKNRKPKKWKDKIEPVVGDAINPLLQSLLELERRSVND